MEKDRRLRGKLEKEFVVKYKSDFLSLKSEWVGEREKREQKQWC